MALKLNERYPGRFNNPSPDYPQGSFKNRTTPTAKDGSYLEKDWANDKEGFFQSLLSSASVVANGSVDKVGGSQYFNALSSVIKSTAIPWSKVNNTPTNLLGYGITDAVGLSGGSINGTLTLNNGTEDAPDLQWSSPTATIGMDMFNRAFRIYGALGAENTTPLFLDLPTKTAAVFGRTIWDSGNLDPSTLQNKVGIQGTFKNLLGSASGTNATATYSADEIIVESAANSYQVLRSVNVSSSLAVSGANGLDAGVSAAATWYSAWVIWNGTTIAGLFSLSATSPVMPAGYTHKARIGWVRSDASKNVVSFIQAGKSWRYKSFGSTTNVVAPTLAAGQAGDAGVPTWAAVSVSSAVPPTAVQIFVIANSLTTNGLLFVHPNQYGGSVTNRTNPPQIGQSVGPSGGGSSISALLTLESTNIYWANNTASAFLVCLGFEDNL